MRSRSPESFSERPFWQAWPGAWHPLCGSFSDAGWSFEWHDFEPVTRADWGQSFHPQGLEVCLNLSGTGRLVTSKGDLDVRPETAALYFAGDAPVNAWREAGQRHQFLTAEFSVDFLRRNLPRGMGQVRPFVQHILDVKKPVSALDTGQPLTPRLRLLVAALRSPPVSGAARTMGLLRTSFLMAYSKASIRQSFPRRAAWRCGPAGCDALRLRPERSVSW